MLVRFLPIERPLASLILIHRCQFLKSNISCDQVTEGIGLKITEVENDFVAKRTIFNLDSFASRSPEFDRAFRFWKINDPRIDNGAQVSRLVFAQKNLLKLLQVLLPLDIFCSLHLDGRQFNIGRLELDRPEPKLFLLKTHFHFVRLVAHKRNDNFVHSGSCNIL